MDLIIIWQHTIVAAIGYYRDYAEIIDVDKCRFDDLKFNINQQKYFGDDGLYFCGFWIGSTGQIREIALDAQKIANDIAGNFYSRYNGWNAFCLFKTILI